MDTLVGIQQQGGWRWLKKATKTRDLIVKYHGRKFEKKTP